MEEVRYSFWEKFFKSRIRSFFDSIILKIISNNLSVWNNLPIIHNLELTQKGFWGKIERRYYSLNNSSHKKYQQKIWQVGNSHVQSERKLAEWWQLTDVTWKIFSRKTRPVEKYDSFFYKLSRKTSEENKKSFKKVLHKCLRILVCRLFFDIKKNNYITSNVILTHVSYLFLTWNFFFNYATTSPD